MSAATSPGGTTERLNRYLARRGVASRRAADTLIAAGRVTVNGIPGELGTVVAATVDTVRVDGRAIHTELDHQTLMLNKPPGVLTTRRDPRGRPTVMDFVERHPSLVPVGRLDMDTRGLLLLSTDGELAHRVAHPRYEVHKVYRAVVHGEIEPARLQRLTSGVELEDGFARALRARPLQARQTLELVMTEGRRREVRRLCAAVGLEVVDLMRVAVGPLRLGALAEGASRRLLPDEDAALRQCVGLRPHTED